MKLNSFRTWRINDLVTSYIVFACLLVFTYGLLFLAPYPGFYFNPSDGAIMAVYEDRTPETERRMALDDILLSVGSFSLTEYRESDTLNLFAGLRAGDIVEVVVRRGEETITIPWVYPGFNKQEFTSRFFNIWWLAYVFWFFGTWAQLFMRPKDRRWGLFVAFSYLTGMFIMLGSVSSYQLLWSPILLRVVAWLILPVSIHFHWIFPHSLRPVPRWLKVVFYTLSGVFALMQVLPAASGPWYFVAVILAFGGSILLLVAHFVFQPVYRREVGILAVAALASLGFTIAVSISGASGSTPQYAALSLLALPFLPATYFYVLYRRNLGGLELRANRAISLYFFTVLLGILLLLLFGFLDTSREVTVFSVILTALAAAFVSIMIFPLFQSFVERHLLGIKLQSQSLSEDYSARIITSENLSALLDVLKDELFPSLLIRQYAFVRTVDASVQVMLSENVTPEQVQEEALRNLFASLSKGELTPFSNADSSLDWVLLTLPLRFGPNLIGVWLLGRRDPDDRYPQAELPVLQSLANQTAVALSYIVQTERIRSMYEANINRYEQERLRLGHELHDSLLNEMAAMLMKHDIDALPQDFQKSFDGLIVRLREIVTYLRPPMLTYGLKYALDGLADNLSERTHDVMHIHSEIQSPEPCNYPEIVEHNLYRIVQEACENALKYAHAKSIRITGELTPDCIDLQVTDDGVGLKNGISLRLDDMVANKHYGLAGMHERAELIGAGVQIDSQPGQGTQVRVTWIKKDTI